VHRGVDEAVSLFICVASLREREALWAKELIHPSFLTRSGLKFGGQTNGGFCDFHETSDMFARDIEWRDWNKMRQRLE
jgi:hypothetical protein